MERPLRLARSARHGNNARLAGDGERALRSDAILQAFGANRPKLYASTNAMSQAIVSGEIDLGVTNSFGVIQMADTGAPMAGVIPKQPCCSAATSRCSRRRRIRTPRGCSATSPARPKAKRIDQRARARRSQPIRRRSAPKAGSLAELGKAHTFSQPDYKKIIADTPASCSPSGTNTSSDVRWRSCGGAGTASGTVARMGAR